MKKISTVLIVLALVTTFKLTPIGAHELETNQTVGAVLHMSPEDDPIVGEQTGFYFEFKDKESKFSPEKCVCTFSIEESGKEIYSQNLFQNNTTPTLENASAYFTFPKKAIYKVKIVGEPIEDEAFNSFEIEYDVNVQREAPPPPQSQPSSKPAAEDKTIMYGLVSLFLIGLGVVILLKKRK